MAKFHSVIEQELEEESYFVSMTDMMVGLLFIFILILMYFALQYQKSTENLENAESTRSAILHEIKDRLEQQNIEVTIDEQSGILRLPEESLRFNSGQAEIDSSDHHVITSLAAALSAVLPCYSKSVSPKPEGCPETVHKLEAVFVEGHTDSDRIIVSRSYKDNWELSVARSVNTFRAIMNSEPSLSDLKNASNEHLLSVSGYGENRPIVENDSDDHKRMNRRIDLRFIMATPKHNIVKPVIEGVEENIQ